MSGGNKGTGGGGSGTNRFPSWPLFAIIAGFLLAVILVNVSSHLIEDPNLDLWEPALWEFSSYFAILALVPAIYYGYYRFHWRRLGVAKFLLVQTLCFLVFSAVHIALMVAIRDAGYALAHEHYHFARRNLAIELIYEGRKDALTFILISGIIWANERLRQQSQPNPPERLEIRSDGRTHYIQPADIISAEAAGNYVELYLTTAAKPLLLRATLGDYEERLKAHGVVRVHRSRLVNRSHIRTFAATQAGDLKITLSDGREVAGSRRFRSALEVDAKK